MVFNEYNADVIVYCSLSIAHKKITM